MGEVPVMMIPCVAGRVDAQGPGGTLAAASIYGSIIPAAWSFMIAARARGIGTAWTTLHLMHEQEIADMLGIPYQEYSQVALIPIASAVANQFAGFLSCCT